MRSKLKTKTSPYYFYLLAVCVLIYGCMPGEFADNGKTGTMRAYKGLFNPENNEFVDCNTQAVLFLLDSTQIISTEARKKGGNSVYVELSGMTFSSDSMEVGSAYDSVILVQKLNTIQASEITLSTKVGQEKVIQY